jgi:hypothetical protein
MSRDWWLPGWFDRLLPGIDVECDGAASLAPGRRRSFRLACGVGALRVPSGGEVVGDPAAVPAPMSHNWWLPGPDVECVAAAKRGPVRRRSTRPACRW